MKKLHDVCTVEGCSRGHKARGYCQTHYMMFKRGSGIKAIKPRERNKPDKCSEDGCNEPVKAKRLCKAHYQRLLRHGHTKYKDRKKEPKPCLIPACNNVLYAKGLCHSHYAKQRVWKEFGITPFDYLRMYEKQDGKCKICHQPETASHSLSGKTKDLAIDHCHRTNKVRGLLCLSCNTAIGLLRENVQTLRSAIAYLSSNLGESNVPD